MWKKIQGDGRTGASGCVPTANKRGMTMPPQTEKEVLVGAWMCACNMLDKKAIYLVLHGPHGALALALVGGMVLATRRTLLSSATRSDTNQQPHPYGTGRTPDSPPPRKLALLRNAFMNGNARCDSVPYAMHVNHTVGTSNLP